MYIAEENGHYKVHKGRRPSIGIADSFIKTEFKSCGLLWRKWAIYETDPTTVCTAAVGGSLGKMYRVTPRFHTKQECVDWLESQEVEGW